jgi:F-type H+-transporting ATPase subunit gamma
MSERLADVRARIEGVRQLGSVVNAMRGIAAARAQGARNQLVAVDAYAQTIALAIGRALTLARSPGGEASRSGGRTGLVVFVAEQGFAGAFSERLLDALGADIAACDLFMIGSRGMDVAAQRRIRPFWTSAAPSHAAGAPKLAERIVEALFRRLLAARFTHLDMAFTAWAPGRGFHVERQRLFPLDLGPFALPPDGAPPLVQLPPDQLLRELADNYLHAQLCRAALHSFAAENQARMEAMAAARRQVDSRLETLRGDERRVRQDQITDEIIELSAGELAARSRGDIVAGK